MKFLFFPRYCEKCLLGFWWEKIMFKLNVWWVPEGCPFCGGFLWKDKKNAIRQFNENNKNNRIPH